MKENRANSSSILDPSYIPQYNKSHQVLVTTPTKLSALNYQAI